MTDQFDVASAVDGLRGLVARANALASHALSELLGDPGPIDEPVPSARSFAQAASLLDEVIYEQVVECIDLDALYRLEHSLTLLIGELDGIAGDRVCETAKAMLDRALRRLPDDVWRYLRAGDATPLEGCSLGEDDPRPGDDGMEIEGVAP